MIVVLSGVSGSGKDTIKTKLIERNSDIVSIPSYTSRGIREFEIEGKEYYHVDKKTFENMIKDGKFYEYNIHHDNYYGTNKEILDNAISEGKIIVKDIDVNGTKALKDIFKGNVKIITIFLYISKEEMEKRLRNREDNLNEEKLKLRISRYDYETEKSIEYDYVIDNNNVEETVKKIEEIIAKERKI